MNKYDYIIWDFNGTIYDDVQISIDTMNVLLRRRNLNIIKSKEEYKSNFGFPVINGYVKLGFDLEKEKYSDIAIEWVNEYLSRECFAKLSQGIDKVLKYYYDRNYKQVIISATKSDMLRNQIKRLNIGKFFNEIVGTDNIHAGGKIDIAKEWRTAHPYANLIFIGDTDHDYLVAKEIKADCILVSCGHQTRKRLTNVDKNIKVVDKIEDILMYI